MFEKTKMEDKFSQWDELAQYFNLVKPEGPPV